VGGDKPSIPTGITVESSASRQIIISWIPNETSENVAGYNIYRGNSAAGFFIKINTGLINNLMIKDSTLKIFYLDTEITNGIDYWYKIAGVNEAGTESDLSTAVSGQSSAPAGGDFRLEPMGDYQEQIAGLSAQYKIMVISEGDFAEKVNLTTANLPSGIQSQFVPSVVNPTGTTTLMFFISDTVPADDYTIKINAISANRSHEIYLGLRVVQLDEVSSAISAHLNKDRIRLGETAEVYGKILPMNPNTHLVVNVKHESEDAFTSHPKKTDIQGNYIFRFNAETRGTYQIYSEWVGSQHRNGDSSPIVELEVIKGRSSLTCATITENIELNSTAIIKGSLRPELTSESITMRIKKPDDSIEIIKDFINTDIEGKYSYNLTLDTEGIWEISACWDGNNDYVGVISHTLRLYPGIEVGQALIVAGGGISSNTLWSTTEYLANRFYKMLRNRRFTHDLIHYISPHIADYDTDGDGEYDIFVDDITPEVSDIQNYLESLYPEGTSSLVDQNKPLIIYFVDHGGANSFKVSNGEILKASHLDAWLDDLQENTPCQVQIIIEACHSGTFVDDLAPTGTQERIIITSTGEGFSNYDQVGIQSFSQYFINHISQGDSLGNSYLKTSDKLRNLRLFLGQLPVLEDNQGGILARSAYIGGTFMVGDVMPEIIDHTPNQAIDAASFTLYARVSDVEGMDHVWATIMPPGFEPPRVTEDFETPIISLDTVELSETAEAEHYTGTYTDFAINGIYVVTLYAMDIGGNVVTREILLTVENGVDPVSHGDVNGSGTVDLADGILALQVLCGVDPGDETVNPGADVNRDGRIGLAEVVYVMRKVAEGN